MILRFRLAMGAVLLGLPLFFSDAAAQQATPAAPVPVQKNEARNRIQGWLHESISRMPDAGLLHGGITPADVPRVKACVVQAVVADIPDGPARRIADALSQDPPAQEEVVEDWILAAFEKTGERRRQVMEQVKTLCPEFQGAFAS